MSQSPVADLEAEERQRDIFAAFLSLPSPTSHEQARYDAGWRYSVEYERLKSQKVPIEKRQRKARVRELARLSHKIVSAHRDAALRASGPMKRLALLWLRKRGGVEHFNIAKFARYVRQRPPLARTYSSGVAAPLSAKRIRVVLNELGIKGRPGRKQKTP
jgi:hypothetical protein